MTKFKPGTFIIVPNKAGIKDLSMKAQVTWFALCAYADDDGVCYPSKKTLSRLSGIGERTLSRGLEELRDKQWIKWNVKKKKDGSFESNTYTLFLVKSK